MAGAQPSDRARASPGGLGVLGLRGEGTSLTLRGGGLVDPGISRCLDQEIIEVEHEHVYNMSLTCLLNRI